MHRSPSSGTWFGPALLALTLGSEACWRPGGGTQAPAPAAVPLPVASKPVPITQPVQTPPPDPAPASFVRSTSDTKSTRIIELRDGLTRAAAFRTARDALNQTFTVDASDAQAGFLMTTWQATVVRDGVPDLRYRTRLIVRFPVDDPHQLTLRADANWQRGDEWDVGYDSALLEQTAADLRAKLGKRP